jgi:hypothetical protein
MLLIHITSVFGLFNKDLPLTKPKESIESDILVVKANFKTLINNKMKQNSKLTFQSLDSYLVYFAKTNENVLLLDSKEEIIYKIYLDTKENELRRACFKK